MSITGGHDVNQSVVRPAVLRDQQYTPGFDERLCRVTGHRTTLEGPGTRPSVTDTEDINPVFPAVREEPWMMVTPWW